MKTPFNLCIAAASMLLSCLAAVPETPGSQYARQIEARLAFPSALERTGSAEPQSVESSELLAALDALQTNSLQAGLDGLEHFLVSRPGSAWAPSLHVQLAEYYAGRGRLTLALAHWQDAWALAKDRRDEKSQGLAVRIAAHWGGALAGLGHKETLTTLVQELDSFALPLHSYATPISANKARLERMRARPGIANACGLVALSSLAGSLRLDDLLKRQLLQTRAPDAGFSVADLLNLARANAIPLDAVRRPAGAGFVVPSVIHWKLNHYGVILEKKGDRFRVVDSALNGELWMDAGTLDAEASGVFLVPADKAPPGWAKLNALESAAVVGRGYPNGFVDSEDSSPDECDGGDESDANCDPPSSNDGGDGGGPPDPPPPCCGGDSSSDGGGSDPSGDGGSNDPASSSPYDLKTGRWQGASPQGTVFRSFTGDEVALGTHGMAQWRISEPYISLWLHDTPLFYRLSSGKPMQLKLTYKQRAEAKDNRIGGFGTKWECNWLGLLYGKEGVSYFTNHLSGGGKRGFNSNRALEYSSARRVCTAIDLRGPIRPMLANEPICITGNALAIESSTGSGNCYDFPVSFPTRETNYFLTHRMDRYGRTIQFKYETAGSVTRVASVIDIDGRTNTFSYTNSGFANLITAVTDPYGRVARFFYDNLGRLTNITDMAGLSSSFKYDTSDNITNLTTLYGQTSFTSYEGTGARYNSQNRALLVTEPTSEHQLFAYCDNGPGAVSGDGFSSYRNSYHWDRAQYAAISAQGKTNYLDMPDAEYQLASVKHWLHGSGFPTLMTVSDTMDAMGPAVDPATATRLPYFTFKYQGQSSTYPFVVGTLKRVTQVSICSTPSVEISRNSLGRPEIVTKWDSFGQSFSYTNIFDPSGRFLQRQLGNRGQLVRRYGYHPVYTNLLTSVTNAVGDVIRYTHDTNTMKVTSITFPSGLVRTNIYYSSGPNIGCLQAQMDVDIRTNSFSYTNGNVWIHTNALGLVTTNLWDNLNRLVSVKFPDGTSISNNYNKLDLSRTKDRLDHWTSYGFNAVRQLTYVTNANGQVTRYDYCSCGSPSQITRWLGARALSTTFGYDVRGRLTNSAYADGYQINRAYNMLDGTLQSISDSGGRQVDLEYAHIGLNFFLTNAFPVAGGARGSALLTQAYDEYGQVLQSRDRNFITVTNGYDLAGRLVARQAFGPLSLYTGEALSGLETFIYDSRGLTNYFDPLGHLTSFVRDPAGRILSETNANLETLQFTYNPAGQLTTLMDGKNQATAWHHDEYGRVTNKVDATGTEILRYIYDPESRLTNRWSIAKGVTSYNYDDLGNLLSIVYPQSTLSYSYDSLNRLTNMVDTVGTTAFTWTDGDQLASEDGPWASDTISYSYTNPMRAAMSLAQPNALPWVQSYIYDDYRRLTSTTSPAGTFGYSYDYFDLIHSLNYPSGAHSDRAYDDLNRLTGITLYAPDATILDQDLYSYDQGSQRTQQVFTAGNFVNYTYDKNGQIKTATGWEPDGTTPRLHEQFGYAYDPAWNLNYRTNNQLIETFAVNNLNELSSASRSGTLTVAGALSQKNGVSAVTVSGTGLSSGLAELYADGGWARAGATPLSGPNTYNASTSDSYGRTAQDSVAVNLPISTAFYYDGNGNLTNDGAKIFEYDTENQLTSVTVSNAWRSEFMHDGMMRRRVRREYTWSSGAWLETNEVGYVYDGLLSIQERSRLNVPSVTYTRGLDLGGGFQLAGGIGGLLARTAGIVSAAHAYYFSDGSGNISELLSTNNVSLARYSYDPFGNVLAKSGNLAEENLYRFSSKEVDPNSGLSCFGLRYYSAATQRWVNRDPIGEVGGLNLYTFVRNRPQNSIDGFGLCDQLGWAEYMSEHPPSAKTRKFMAVTGGAVLTAEALGAGGWAYFSYRVAAARLAAAAALAAVQRNIAELQDKFETLRVELIAAMGDLKIAQDALKSRGGSSAAVGKAQQEVSRILAEMGKTWAKLKDQEDALAKAKDACGL